MFVPLWILVPAVLLLLWLLARAFGDRGDMIERQQRAATPVSPQLLAQALADPEIRARFDTFAFEPLAWSPEEITRNAEAKSKVYGELVKRGNISLD